MKERQAREAPEGVRWATARAPHVGSGGRILV